MDYKHVEAYLLIDKAFSARIADDAEILVLLKEFLKYNEDGAVMVLSDYYENKKEIQTYIKKNKLDSDKNALQLGE